MKKDLNINLALVRRWLARLKPLAKKHGSFAASLLVLLIYLFVVWRISSLAAAEPSESELSAALNSSAVPNINKQAINKIQSLEQNSPQLKSLFNQARNNPFQE